jgi:hypothetical protein
MATSSGTALAALATGANAAGLTVDAVNATNERILADLRHTGKGMALRVRQTNADNPEHAVHVTTAGTGYAFIGRTTGMNSAAGVFVDNTANSEPAFEAHSKGQGFGLDAKCQYGVGARFQGKNAAIELIPSTAGTHPATGRPGQLFVDSRKRLWYCKGGTDWKLVVA